jgi:hypothetical protein
MWLLHFLPDSFLAFVVNAVLVLGVASTVITFFVINPILRRIPTLSKYVTLAQIASLVVLTAGVYFKGGYSAEMQWRERVAEMEAKVAQAEVAAKDANVKIETKTTEKIKVIREKGMVIKQYVDREVTKYDSTCVIPDAVIKAHNAAARNEEIK